MKPKSKSGRQSAKEVSKPQADEPASLGTVIEEARTRLGRARAVLRCGYVAALYAEWHDVNALTLADVFHVADALIDEAVGQLESAGLISNQADARVRR